MSSTPPLQPGSASGASGVEDALRSGLDMWWRREATDAGATTAFLRECAQGSVSLADTSRLARIDPAGLDADARVDLIQAWERVRAQIDGAQQLALAAVIDATKDAGLDGEWARHEVGAALRLSPVTAYRRTNVAAVPTTRLPATMAALSAGDISYGQAAALASGLEDMAADLADGVAGLDVDVVKAIETRVLKAASDQTIAETRRAVARAVIAADTASAQQRHERAVRRRTIDRSVLPDAMAGWWITMPAPAAATAWRQLTATALATQRSLRAGAGQDPGLDALRVDTLLDSLLDGQAQPRTERRPEDPPGGVERQDRVAAHDLATGRAAAAPTPPSTQSLQSPPALRRTGSPQSPGSSHSGPASQSKRAPRCHCGGAQTAAVVVDLPTLLALAENPGELPGYGAIPPGMARELAADMDWVRWTADPGTRRLLDRGARRYRPSARMRAYLAAATPTCTFPGCGARSEDCDTDHRITFARGGPTIVANLGPLCRQHHNAKTHGRWRVRGDPSEDHGVGIAGPYDIPPSGAVLWTSPLGRTYTSGTEPPLP